MMLEARHLKTINELYQMFLKLKTFEEEKPDFTVSWTTSSYGPEEITFKKGKTGGDDMYGALFQLKKSLAEILLKLFDVKVD